MKSSRQVLALALIAVSTVFAAPAMAVTTADQMTCAQAVATYKKYKRIYVVANGKDVVPLYGMTPIEDRSTIRCRGRGKSITHYWVNTLDNDECMIAAFCR